MSAADMIPTLPDDALDRLRLNAVRIEAGPPGAKQKSAADLLPLIDAEMAERKARLPPPTPKTRKPKVAKAAAAPAAEPTAAS